MTASFPIISELFLLGGLLLAGGCKTSSDSYADLGASAPITYPFFEADQPLGKDKADDRFVIRTISGPTEYVVEIPQAAMDYDVEVPVASAAPGAERITHTKNPQITDRELVASMPKLDEKAREDQALTDKIIGVNSRGGPSQSPSYVMNIEKINQLYRDNDFEYALVEINNLLAFYPTDTKLYKMKGTILFKLGNYQLAEKAWLRASHLAPDDAVVRKGLEYLRRIMERNKRLTASESIPMPGTAVGSPLPPPGLSREAEQAAQAPSMPLNIQPLPARGGMEPSNALTTRSRLEPGNAQRANAAANAAYIKNHANAKNNANATNHTGGTNRVNAYNNANAVNQAGGTNGDNSTKNSNSNSQKANHSRNQNNSESSNQENTPVEYPEEN